MLCLWFASAPPASAALKTWDGNGGTGNWSTTANWTPASAPVDGDDLSFPAGALNLSNTNNIGDLRVNTIQFSGAAGGYVLSGNAITVSNGIVAAHTAGDNDVNFATITNAANQTYTVDSGGTLDVNANIVLIGGLTLTINNDFTTRLDGSISGTGNIVKSSSGTGTLAMGGTVANTYVGNTTVNAGTLTLGKSTGVTSVPGSLFVGDGGGTDTVQLLTDNQIANGSAITFQDSGVLDLNGNVDTVGTVTFNGGTINTGLGDIGTGNITVNANAAVATINGILTFTGTRTLSIADGTAAPCDLVINAVVEGAGGITKTGAGTLCLNAANTYSGLTTLSAGVVRLDDDSALGSTANGTTVSSGATLFFEFGVLNLPEVLTLNGTGTAGQGALYSIGVANIVTNVVLGSATTVTIATNGFSPADTTIDGIISGTGGLTKLGIGTLTFSGASGNTYSGITTVEDGVLVLNKAAGDAIPGAFVIGDESGADDSAVVRLALATQFATADVTILADGLLDLNGFAETVNNLTLSGGNAVSGPGGTTAALFVNGVIDIHTPYPLDTTSRISGLLNVGTGTKNIFFPIGSLAIGAPELELDARVTGSALISVGGNSGDLYLNSSNDFTGGFTVDGGNRLLVHIGNDFALGAVTSGTTNSGSAGFFIELAANFISEPLTLCGIGPIGNGGVLSLTGSANWNTNVVLACDATINCPGGTALTINGVISGSGGFTKVGTGTLTLSGTTGGNSYSGGTIVNEGVMVLDKSLAIGSSASLIIGDGVGAAVSDIVRYSAANGINSSVPILIQATGLLDLNGFNDTVGAITMVGGDIETGAGTMTMNNNLTASGGGVGFHANIAGNLSLGAATRTFTVTNYPSAFAADLAVSAVVSGTGGIIKVGDGLMVLSGSNSFSGAVTVNDGDLDLQDDFAAGTTAGGVVVNGDASLGLFGNINVGAEALTLNSTAATGSLTSRIVSNSWAGSVTLSINTIVRVSAGDTLNLLGAISGPGGMTKIETGTLIYSGALGNGYTGVTTVNAGTLLLSKTAGVNAMRGDLVIGDGLGGANADVVRLNLSDQILDISDVTVNSSGLLDLEDTVNETIGSLAGSGHVELGVNSDLYTGVNNSSTLFSGTISGVSLADLEKQGTGTMTLTGTNTYNGATRLNEGTLLVNGFQPQSPVTIDASGTLGGTGTVGNISASGVIAPGTSPGILTSSNVAFTATGTFPVELNGTAAGSGFDQLNVRGTSSLTGAALSVSVGFLPAEDDQFRIINNDGADAITGTFDGLPEGAVVGAGNFRFRVSYVGGTGNDVVLTVTNQFLKPGAAFVFSGNGNGAIEPDECNLLSLVVSNLSSVAMTGLNATLHSLTPGVAVNQPFSTYPNIPANNRRTNDSMFQVTTAPGFVCGTDVNLELEVITATHGTLIVPFSLPSGVAGAGVRFNNNVVTAIPDASFVDSTVAVAGITTPLKKVVVLLHITHTAASDLDVSLIGPDGNTVQLTSDNGGVSSDYGVDCTDPRRTTFDSSAATAITAGVAPFVGTFRPEESLTSFDEKSGTDVNGLWTLRVVDDTPGAVGSIRCWSLILSPTACAPGSGICELCPDVTITGALGTSSLKQTDRLFRDLPATACGSPTSTSGVGGIGQLSYDAYVFQNGPSDACISVSLTSTDDVFSAAYTDAFVPSNIFSNYLADAGQSTAQTPPTTPYSFKVGANEVFVVTVNEIGVGSGGNYVLSVTGGDCRPELNISAASLSQAALDWTTAALGYHLERTNHLTGIAGNWESIPGVPLVVNSRFTVTNNVSGTNQFYRLVKP